MRQVGGYIAVALGALLGVGILLNAGGPHGTAALLLSFALFSVTPVALGVRLVRAPAASASLRLAAERAWDAELLRLASRSDGSLSVQEVVMHADLDAAEAERRLDDLSRRGWCEPCVTEAGIVVYRFQPSPSASEKRGAEQVLP